MSSIFVTVGSTKFEPLTSVVLSEPFLEKLMALGISRLVVQYGSASIILPPKACDTSNEMEITSSSVIERATGSKHGHGHGHGADSFDIVRAGHKLTVRYMRYTSTFDEEIHNAAMVISHAGSGSILTSLRASKPTLVIPNNSLMDDHQSELARALHSGGYLGVSSVDTLLRDIPAFIARAKSHNEAHQQSDHNGDGGDVSPYRPFPTPVPSRFVSILDEVAGFAS